MDKSILNQFRLTVSERNLGVYGIKVVNAKGESVSHRWRSDDPVQLYSASKTFTALAVGMCIDDGKLAVTDKILDFFPQYKAIATPGSEEITIRDLLHMASGKLDFWFGVDEITENTTDWAELFFRMPVKKKPGTFFCYSNACTYMLSRAVECVSGEKLRDFLVPRLFTPLRIYNPQWHTCPTGHTVGAIGLCLTTEQLSHLGPLLLSGGKYEGKRIISESYLHDAVNDVFDNKDYSSDAESASGYGYQMWRCTYPGAYRVDGMYGQFVIVVPDKSATITITAHNEHCANDIVRAVFDDIVPYL
ncbi:MAG TPA: serine hydrolase [Oscillospiraceae bacterium]|nr:serine hydrolase [Oscillospiraceae bacterium]